MLASISAAEGQLVEEGAEFARLDDRQAQLLQQKAQAELDVSSERGRQRSRGPRGGRSGDLRRRGTEPRKKPSSDCHKASRSRSWIGCTSKSSAPRWNKNRRGRNRKSPNCGNSSSRLNARLPSHHAQRHSIVAPLTGMVAKRYRHRGEWVQPGDKVFRIVRLDRLRAEGFVDAASVRGTLTGRQATLTVDLPGQPQTRFSGTVTFVDPEIDPVNRQIRIWVEIDNPAAATATGNAGRDVHRRGRSGERPKP